MAAIRTMTTLNDKPLTAIREVGSVHALTDVTGTSPLPLLLLLHPTTSWAGERHGGAPLSLTLSPPQPILGGPRQALGCWDTSGRWPRGAKWTSRYDAACWRARAWVNPGAPTTALVAAGWLAGLVVVDGGGGCGTLILSSRAHRCGWTGYR
jgi:hypothetical protein